MMTDEYLIKLIERLREPAARSFRNEHVAEEKRSRDVQPIWEVAKPLKAAMTSHPEFMEPHSKYFLGKQVAFFNRHQSVNLLRVALRDGGAEALAWYRRIIATERAEMRVVAQVHGLLVQKRHVFSNSVTLLPVWELPDSPNSSSLKQPQTLRLGLEFPAAVMVELRNIENEPHDIGHKRFLETSEMMGKTIAAFVLSEDAAPTMAESWQEFADPELESAEFGRTWMSSQHEGRLPRQPVNVTDEMLDWVEKYLRLPPEVANACEVPLARLNLARRRVAPGTKRSTGAFAWRRCSRGVVVVSLLTSSRSARPCYWAARSMSAGRLRKTSASSTRSEATWCMEVVARTKPPVRRPRRKDCCCASPFSEAS